MHTPFARASALSYVILPVDDLSRATDLNTDSPCRRRRPVPIPTRTKMAESDPDVIRVSYEGRVATITIDNTKKLNALSLMQYYDLATKMQEIAKRDDIYVTFLTGNGRFFSA